MSLFDESDLWIETHNEKENFRDALIFLAAFLIMSIVWFLV